MSGEQDSNTPLLTVEEVCGRLEAAGIKVSIRTLWRWVRRGLFPEPVRLSRKTIRWRPVDVQGYIDGLVPTVKL